MNYTRMKLVPIGTAAIPRSSTSELDSKMLEVLSSNTTDDEKIPKYRAILMEFINDQVPMYSSKQATSVMGMPITQSVGPIDGKVIKSEQTLNRQNNVLRRKRPKRNEMLNVSTAEGETSHEHIEQNQDDVKMDTKNTIRALKRVGDFPRTSLRKIKKMKLDPIPMRPLVLPKSAVNKAILDYGSSPDISVVSNPPDPSRKRQLKRLGDYPRVTLRKIKRLKLDHDPTTRPLNLFVKSSRKRTGDYPRVTLRKIKRIKLDQNPALRPLNLSVKSSRKRPSDYPQVTLRKIKRRKIDIEPDHEKRGIKRVGDYPRVILRKIKKPRVDSGPKYVGVRKRKGSPIPIANQPKIKWKKL